MKKLMEFKNAQVLTRNELRLVTGGKLPGQSCPSGETLHNCVTTFQGGGVNEGVACCASSEQCESRAQAAYEQQGLPPGFAQVSCSAIPVS